MTIRTALTALLFTCIHAAALEPGAPFAEHAVLQRQQPLPVWGWSKPGTEEHTKSIQQKILESAPTTPEHKTAWGKFPQLAAELTSTASMTHNTLMNEDRCHPAIP